MMKTLLTAAIVSVASLAFTAAAQAQVVVPPGQDFYATPVSSTGVSMPVGRIVQPAPAAAKKHHAKRAMKRKVMKRKMKRS